VDFVIAALAVPAGTATFSAHANCGPGVTSPLSAAGIENIPLLVLVSAVEAFRLEAKLGGESQVDSGLGRLTADSAASVLRETVGAGWIIFATKQLKRIPAIEEGSVLPPVAPTPCGGAGDALGLGEDPS
jgi:hypothetical protein